jgi:putative SOS response-associated peptidase YedK
VDWRAERRDWRASTLCFPDNNASNDVVRPIHAKAMPVMLTAEQEFDTWLDASVNDAIALERPLPNELLRIVATGEKSDSTIVNE